MHVEHSHRIDASERDAAGRYDYYYEYDLYRFVEGTIGLVARSYIDEADEAHFLRIQIDGNERLMEDADLARPLFMATREHLRSIGKVQLRWLSGRGDGYEPVPD